MLAIYKYTLFKYFKSYSTWVIMAFSAIVIGFIIGGMLPFLFIDVAKPNAAKIYSKTVILTVAGITVFLGIFSAIFAGFKSATMFKDEVENGTFLVLISKPMKRSEIIFGKWFALQTLLLMYSVVSVLALCTGISIFDNGSQISGLKAMGIGNLKTEIWYAGIFIFIILYLTALIFSSLGIMISTKLSTGSTIGIIIAIGVYIPISGLIGMFIRKPEAYPVSNQQVISDIAHKSIDNEFEHNKLVSQLYPDLKNKVDQFFSTTDSTDIYNLAVSADQKDNYKNFFWLDVDYQFKLLSSYAYESLIPEEYVSVLQSSSSLQGAMQTPEEVESTGLVRAKDYYNKIEKFITNFSEISDDLNQLLAWKHLLNMQPVTVKDVVAFFFSNESNGLIVSGKESELIDNLNTETKDGNFSFDKLQSLFVKYASYFNEPKQAIRTFLKWVTTSENRDDSNFLIKDDYLVKVHKSRLNDLDGIIWQAYNYFDKSQTWQIHSAYPQALFDELKKHYSSDIVSFLQEVHREFKDPKYIVRSDDGTENDDFRYIDFKLYKKWISLLFLQEVDPQTGKVKYPMRNAISYDITTNRLDSNGELLFDDQLLRASILKADFWQHVRAQLKKDNKMNEVRVFIADTDQIYQILHPIVTFIIKGDIAKSSFPNVEIQNRHLSELRKTIQGSDYDAVNRIKRSVYNDSTQDPMTNLAQADLSSLEYVLSGMVDHQVVTYSAKPYANRDVVLSIYVIIAVALVPITYFVVKRQDFR